jgi:DNA-binding response OmpR family regulator
MHVLIIEDDPGVVLLVTAILQQAGGFATAAAATEDAAVAAAREQRPGLIIADFNLAEGNGVSAVRRICADAAIPHFYMTAAASDVRALVPGAIILSKPFSVGDFRRLLAAVTKGDLADPIDEEQPLLERRG